MFAYQLCADSGGKEVPPEMLDERHLHKLIPEEEFQDCSYHHQKIHYSLLQVLQFAQILV